MTNPAPQRVAQSPRGTPPGSPPTPGPSRTSRPRRRHPSGSTDPSPSRAPGLSSLLLTAHLRLPLCHTLPDPLSPSGESLSTHPPWPTLLPPRPRCRSVPRAPLAPDARAAEMLRARTLPGKPHPSGPCGSHRLKHFREHRTEDMPSSGGARSAVTG